MPEPQEYRVSNREWLPVIFEMVVGRKCDYDDQKDRRLIQCVIFMLEYYGVLIGEYGFDLLKNGVVSMELYNDLDHEFYQRKGKLTHVNLGSYSMDKINIVHEYVTKDCIPYEPLEYMEVLCACCWIHCHRIWDKSWQELAKEYEDDRKKYGFTVDKKLVEKAAKEIRNRFKD